MSGERWFNGESVCCISMWVRVQSSECQHSRDQRLLGQWKFWVGERWREIPDINFGLVCILHICTQTHTHIYMHMYMHIIYKQKYTKRQNTCFLHPTIKVFQLWLIFCLVFETGSPVAQTGFELVKNDLEFLTLLLPHPSPGITGVRHHAYLVIEPRNSCMLDKYSTS